MTWQLYLSAATIFSISLFASAYSIQQLRQKYGADIRVVWYFVSLSIVVTLGISFWATDKGAIGQNGSFEGSYGEMLKNSLNFMLDLETDLKIMTTIVTLVTAPQFLSYLLSGLSGCAKTPLLIEGSLSFFIWGLVKSFAVSAGIIFSLTIFSIVRGWHSFWPGSFASMYTSLLLVMLSFFTLLMYRETEAVAADFQKYLPKLAGPCIKIHRWLTRHTNEVPQL